MDPVVGAPLSPSYFYLLASLAVALSLYYPCPLMAGVLSCVYYPRPLSGFLLPSTLNPVVFLACSLRAFTRAFISMREKM
nr:hypothetical protein Q903MT_gene491 [Picea sitchensis]